MLRKSSALLNFFSSEKVRSGKRITWRDCEDFFWVDVVGEDARVFSFELVEVRVSEGIDGRETS